MREPLGVLAAVPGFSGATVELRLSEGPTNDSYEILNAGARFVLRIDRPEAARLGLDRRRERRVMDAAAESGLAPAPAWHDIEAGVLIRPYIPGRAWFRSDLLKPKNLERLAALLRRLHALEPVGPRFDPLAAAVRYAEQLDTGEARALCLEAARMFRDIEPAAPVLCHNDLVCRNILEGESLALIDWEYAAAGDALFDLAIVVQHHDLEAERAQRFLSAYLQREPGQAEMRRFEAQCRFYRLLLKLWNLRVESQKSQSTPR
ncbi:MAG: choline/ethanolamine kinase family protein [Lysobacterales bacterium]